MSSSSTSPGVTLTAGSNGTFYINGQNINRVFDSSYADTNGMDPVVNDDISDVSYNNPSGNNTFLLSFAKIGELPIFSDNDLITLYTVINSDSTIQPYHITYNNTNVTCIQINETNTYNLKFSINGTLSSPSSQIYDASTNQIYLQLYDPVNNTIYGDENGSYKFYPNISGGSMQQAAWSDIQQTFTFNQGQYLSLQYVNSDNGFTYNANSSFDTTEPLILLPQETQTQIVFSLQMFPASQTPVI